MSVTIPTNSTPQLPPGSFLAVSLKHPAVPHLTGGTKSHGCSHAMSELVLWAKWGIHGHCR